MKTEENSVQKEYQQNYVQEEKGEKREYSVVIDEDKQDNLTDSVEMDEEGEVDVQNEAGGPGQKCAENKSGENIIVIDQYKQDNLTENKKSVEMKKLTYRMRLDNRNV